MTPRRLSLLAALLACCCAAAQEPASPQPQTERKPPVAHGADLFVSAGCVFCHGAGGISGGKGPSLKDVRRRMSIAQMSHQIHDGGQNMPAFGDILTPQDINDLIAYLRAKKH